MKSIKPGRGPSAMGVLSSLFGVIFSIFWTVMAVQVGAPFFFPIFGVMFVIMSVVSVFYNLKNATGENRFSEYDIVDEDEESDPWNLKDSSTNRQSEYNAYSKEYGTNDYKYCPYCGRELSENFEYCPKCGKKLPF